MKTHVGLRTRILVTSGICSFFLVVISAGFILSQLKNALLSTVAMSPHIFDAEDQAECLENPEAWFKLMPADGAIVYAYNTETGKSLNLNAPPMLDLLWQRLQAGEDLAIKNEIESPFVAWTEAQTAAKFARRVGEAGICGIIQGSFTSLPPVRQAVGMSYLSSSFIGVFIVIGVMMIFTIRPIARRLRRLSFAARSVGLEGEYRSAGDSLRDDIGEIALILDSAHSRMRADAERLEQRRVALEQHLANVAHDLRTPMSSLHLGLQELQGHIESETAKDLLRRTINDSAYLMGLTDNLHLASRLSDGADPTAGHARTDLGALVDKIELRFSLLGKMSGVQVVAARPDKPVWVICDPFIAERALSNIVHNAVTHGEEGGNVAVVLEVVGDIFELVVSDDGPGVPPEDLSMLAERTFRSDEARQRDTAGQGLGLAITHEIAKRSGWTLEFAGVEPRGLQVSLKGSHIG